MRRNLKLVYEEAYERVELRYGDVLIGSAGYDEDGMAGMRIVEEIAEQLQEIFKCKLSKEEV